MVGLSKTNESFLHSRFCIVVWSGLVDQTKCAHRPLKCAYRPLAIFDGKFFEIMAQRELAHGDSAKSASRPM